MAKKIVVLIGVLLISAFHTRTCDADWLSDLTVMTDDIGRRVQSFTQNLQQDIQRSVQSSLQPALAEVQRTLDNLPRDAQGRIISNTGNTLIVNGGNGVTRSIISGRTEDGQPYVRDVEERYVGNMLYHNETNYNPITKTKERICWKVDLTKQGASREALEAC